MSTSSKRQISLLIQKVRGNHVQKQEVIVFINGDLYFLHEKFANAKRSVRYYNNGLSTSINLNEPIQIGFAIITPNSSKSYFVHAVATYSPSNLSDVPLIQNIQVHTLGDLYTIYASLYMAKSQTNKLPAPRRSLPSSLKKSRIRK